LEPVNESGDATTAVVPEPPVRPWSRGRHVGALRSSFGLITCQLAHSRAKLDGPVTAAAAGNVEGDGPLSMSEVVSS
jgi:hypothetical protein